MPLDCLCKALFAISFAVGIFCVCQTIGVIDDDIPRDELNFIFFKRVVGEPSERTTTAWQKLRLAIDGMIMYGRVMPPIHMHTVPPHVKLTVKQRDKHTVLLGIGQKQIVGTSNGLNGFHS